MIAFSTACLEELLPLWKRLAKLFLTYLTLSLNLSMTGLHLLEEPMILQAGSLSQLMGVVKSAEIRAICLSLTKGTA